MNALWSAEQRQWLGALGHVVYVQGAVGEVAEESTAVVPAVTRLQSDMPQARPQRPQVAPAAVDTAPVVAAAPMRRPASRVPDKLHFALIRAAACNPNAPGAAEMMAQWPSTSELRGNPAAKRALWPRLRGLRRPGLP